MVGVRFILQFPFSLRQRRLTASRRPMSRDEFIEAVSSTEDGRNAATMLWNKLNEFRAWDGFTPYPSDDLGRVYGMAEEELDEDTVLDILEKTNTPIPSPEFLEKFGPLKTPQDIIRLVELCNG